MKHLVNLKNKLFQIYSLKIKQNRKMFIGFWSIFMLINIGIIFAVVLLITAPSKTTVDADHYISSSGDYYIEIKLPKSFTVTQYDEGTQSQYKSYKKIIQNDTKSLKVTIETVPKDVQQKVNTGKEGYVPSAEVSKTLHKVTVYEGQELYREDEDTMIHLINNEIKNKSITGLYLNSDNEAIFNVYKKQDNLQTPYYELIKTAHNDSIKITATIDFTISRQDFDKAVAQLDQIIIDLKI